MKKMNKVLYIILISLFTLTVISCAKKSSTSSTTTDNNTSEMRKTTATCSAVCDGLVLYLPFMGDKTDVNTDNLGNTIDNNTLSVSTDNSSTTPTLASDRDGTDNSSYSFDGSDDFLQIDNVSSIALESGSFSVAAIVKVNKSSEEWITYSGGQFSKGKIMHGDNYTFIMGYHWYPEGTNNLWFSVRNSSDTATNAYTSKTNPLQYNHIVGVADRASGTVNLYVNGTLMAGTAWDGNIKNPATKWTIGLSGNSSWDEKHRGNLDGWIDEVRVYNRALSADEVLALYAY